MLTKEQRDEYEEASVALEIHASCLPAIGWEAYYKARKNSDRSVHQADIEAACLLRECLSKNKELK